MLQKKYFYTVAMFALISRLVGVTASWGTLQLFLTFVLGIVPVWLGCLSLFPGGISIKIASYTFNSKVISSA